MTVINFHQQKHHDFNLSSVWSPGVFLPPESKMHLSKIRDEGESLTFLLWRRKGLLGKDGHRSGTEGQNPLVGLPTAPNTFPSDPVWVQGTELKILTWSCNAPCGQTLVQIKAGELCLLSCRNAILSVFSLIIASPLLRTIQIFLIVQFLGIETHIGKKSYTYKGFTWLLWNQNRKSCILHKPANYFILITVIFTP